MNLNKAEVIGNLTRDPQSKALPSGTNLTYFTVATNHLWRDAKTKERKDNAEFHNIIAWGKLGEIIAKYLKKGSKVYVEGRLQTRRWKDRSGGYRNRTDIVANNMIMLGHLGTKKETDQSSEEMAEEEIDVKSVPLDE